MAKQKKAIAQKRESAKASASSNFSQGVEVSAEQVLYFRACRGHLVGEGADDVATAASAILGAQSQQEVPALWALSLRTKGRPTAAEIQAQLTEHPRSLVRTWGQRDTIHMYERADWPTVIAARDLWVSTGRRGGMPNEEELEAAREILRALDTPITRKDLYTAVTARFVKEVEPVAEKARMDPIHFAAGRFLWVLARHGDVCAAHKIGSEQAYVSRELWFPDLQWSTPEGEALGAAAEMAWRYLGTYGPATVQDLAHYFGARVSDARLWLDALPATHQLVPVRCPGFKDMWVRAEDADALSAKIPEAASDWPVRMLPLWDTVLMGHAEKDWLMPEAAERPLVWRKAAHVMAVVLARGRIVATWSHKVRRKSVDITVSPLSLWDAEAHEEGVWTDAQGFARHLGVEKAEVAIAS